MTRLRLAWTAVLSMATVAGVVYVAVAPYTQGH